MTSAVNLFRTVFRPAEFTGWHMTGVVCLFFGTIISVNLFLAFSAATTWTGLIVPNTYVESQKFNDHLAAAEVQKKLEWSADLSAGAGGLVVQMKQADGQPLADVRIIGMLGRPVQEGEDKIIAFAPTDEGLAWRGSLGPGLWRVQLIAEKGNKRWLDTVRFTVPSVSAELPAKPSGLKES